jgi:hypothetical protein
VALGLIEDWVTQGAADPIAYPYLLLGRRGACLEIGVAKRFGYGDDYLVGFSLNFVTALGVNPE